MSEHTLEEIAESITDACSFPGDAVPAWRWQQCIVAALTAEREARQKAEAEAADWKKWTGIQQKAAYKHYERAARIRADTIDECAKVAAGDYAFGIAAAIRSLKNTAAHLYAADAQS